MENFVPPSEDIQQLFRVPLSSDTDMSHKTNSLGDNTLFTEEEFAKMPSTLMKAVRRTTELMQQTEMIRKSVIDMNNELKGVHSLLVRYAKKTLKDAEKSETTEEPGGKVKGFKVQCRISDELCAFLGLEPGSSSSRFNVTNAINKYIRDNGLVDPENAQRILPDDKLWKLLSDAAVGNKITYFSIQKYIKHHYIKSAK
jgi:chromatin remodeling complex protein RSC6